MIDVLIWAILIPLLGGLLAVPFPRAGGLIGILSATIMVVASLILLTLVASQGPQVYLIGGWHAGLGISLYADGLSSLLLLMTALIALGVSIYAISYFRHSGLSRHYWPLWMLLLSALAAMLLAADLFNIYVTLELLGIVAVALTALDGKRPAVEAAVRYLVLGLLGSLAFLVGVALLYTGYGTLDLATLATRIQPGAATWAAASLITAGLLIKSALFPMHFWLPPAHANAPAPVSAALSALVVKAAFYLVLRLWLDLFGTSLSGWSSTLIGLLGAAAVLWGSWCALQAERLKVLAAYSTVAQIGYLFIFLALSMQDDAR
jgi:formate hydrogenlyase subunit 3/multisubunit Na+/H+ antiporter MnhD subunit